MGMFEQFTMNTEMDDPSEVYINLQGHYEVDGRLYSVTLADMNISTTLFLEDLGVMNFPIEEAEADVVIRVSRTTEKFVVSLLINGFIVDEEFYQLK